jgi:DNA-binding NarL/FixJ family response regulator
MATIKVVVADDHRLMIEAVRCVLEAAGGFEVVGEATSGSQVLPIVSRTDPDVVILDLRMPGADGLKCLDWLSSRHASVKVVVLSGVEDSDTIQAALNRGASAFVGKHVDPRDLPSVVRQVLDESVYHALVHALPAAASPADEAGLTPSEQKVLEALTRGLSNKEIARELWLTEQTVKFHLTRIYRRLGVANRTEAVRHAYQNRLVSNPLYEPA